MIDMEIDDMESHRSALVLLSSRLHVEMSYRRGINGGWPAKFYIYKQIDRFDLTPVSLSTRKKQYFYNKLFLYSSIYPVYC